MKIYSASMYGNGTIFVSPGVEHPETSDWIEVGRDGEDRQVRTPIQFAVRFKAGMAEVADELGEYLIAKKLAKRSPVIVPEPPSLQVASGPKYSKPIAVGRPLTEV